MYTNKYDYLFQQQGERLSHDWRLFKAMGICESGLDPDAVSPCGAVGIMQIMPATARDLGFRAQGTAPLHDPEMNIRLGTGYFAVQFDRLKELTDLETRCKAALAAYNGGRGYINKAIAIYREREHMAQPPSWEKIAAYLADPACLVRKKRPDHKQMTEYVRKVWATYQKIITVQDA